MDESILNRCRDLISKNDLDSALIELSGYLDKNPWLSRLIQISRRHHSLEGDFKNGLVSFEERKGEQNKITYSLLELINDIDKDQTDAYLKKSRPPNNINSTVEELIEILSITKEAFIAQAKIRNLLVFNMVNRLEIENTLEFEVFFSTYQGAMNEEDKRLCKTIRSYTENVLSKYNQKVLNLIQDNKILKQEIPRLKELERHLIIWNSKFEGVFQQMPSMCLLYVGVEDGVPFPNGIESDLKLFLEKN